MFYCDLKKEKKMTNYVTIKYLTKVLGIVCVYLVQSFGQGYIRSFSTLFFFFFFTYSTNK